MKIKITAICLSCALLLGACGLSVTPTEPSSNPTTHATEPTTQPVESVTTEPTTQPTEATTQSTEPTTPSTEQTTPPTQTTDPSTESTTEATEPTQSGNSGAVTYEEYQAMSPEGQQAFFNSFESYEDFIAWFIAAEAAYKESQDRNEVSGDGNIDIGDLIGGASNG